MNRRPHNFARRGGFTLLEMMVVGIVGVVMLGVIGNTWRWYLHSVHDIRVVTQLTREVKLAAEAIAQDFGPALAARTIDGSTLQLDYDNDSDGLAGWAAPDVVIEYALSSGKLVRRNLNASTEVPLAGHIQAFEIQTVSGVLQAHVTAASGDETHELIIELKEPS